MAQALKMRKAAQERLASSAGSESDGSQAYSRVGRQRCVGEGSAASPLVPPPSSPELPGNHYQRCPPPPPCFRMPFYLQLTLAMV